MVKDFYFQNYATTFVIKQCLHAFSVISIITEITLRAFIIQRYVTVSWSNLKEWGKMAAIKVNYFISYP